MILVKRSAAFVLALLLMTAPAAGAGAATAVPAGPEDGHTGMQAQLLHWLGAGVDRVLAGLGGFGGTGDDGMGLDPDGGGDGEDDPDDPPPDNGDDSEEGGSTGP